MKIKKILIANRGEIAVRIIRTARKMGILTVAVYSEADRDSLHVRIADEAICIGPSTLSDTYLNVQKLISAALEFHCDAVHPGYGFLAENPVFAIACHDAGLIFIGPDARSMQVMGNKIEARKFVENIGIPVTKGLTGEPDFLLKNAGIIGFPLLVKAAAGGGGKGMRIVRSEEELSLAIESTSREASNYFSDGTVYIEKFIENPRHIEIQLLGDQHGNLIHLFERECSIQRRYQKIIEEAPSPTLTPEVRKKMGESAVAIGKAIGYVSAGTIEFLVDENLEFYFLEMNTRIQVEHPVTELTTGIDIVEEQFRIASGELLRWKQEDIHQKGHAIECRIYAEDPENNFLPAPGKMSLYEEPQGRFIRVDSGISGKPEISGFFDPMIAKLIVTGENREEARIRILEALNHYVIHGVRNNIGFLAALLNHEAFIRNKINTKYCDQHLPDLLEKVRERKVAVNPEVHVIAALIFMLKNTSSPPVNLWEEIGYWRHQMEPVIRWEDRIFTIHLERFTGKEVELSISREKFIVLYQSREEGQLELDIADKHFICRVSLPSPEKAVVSCSGFTSELIRMDVLPAQPEFQGSELMLGSDTGNIVSPMPGRVIKINVEEGQAVKKGEVLLVVEAMKMENSILCPGDGIVDKLGVSVGDLVDGNTRLVHIRDERMKNDE